MLDRRFIVSFLRLNNLDETSSPEAIRETLKKANWTSEETDRALILLHEPHAKEHMLHAVNDPMRAPRAHLSSHNISYLLGIDVVIDPTIARTPRALHTKKDSFLGQLFIFVCTAVLVVGLAAGVGIAYMYIHNVGIFFVP